VVEPVLAAEAALGDSGIVMLDTPDPLCLAAALFDLGTYTVIALTEPALFTDLLERFAAWLLPRTEAIAAALPGRLWRIVGPEYATPPYLPPRLFREYVIPYVEPMVRAIQRHGGYARVHCHGRIRDVLDDIVGMNPDGLDPIEPPPQGDVSLAWVRARCGDRVTLFGNIEASDLENLPEAEFRAKVRQALAEGPGGRGFVLMPSACPYGRVLSARALRNYEVMVEEAEA
jgi:uroporphyrinogen-III decarboxylase